MDAVFEDFGPFGRYQKVCLLLVGCVSALSAMSFYVTIFNSSEPDFKCAPIRSNLSIGSAHALNSSNVNKCDLWNNKSFYTCEFDRTYYDLTAVSEWELVCDKQYLSSLSQTAYLVGTIAAFFSGSIGDKFGRKRATVIFTGCYAIISILAQLLLTDFGKLFGSESGIALSVQLRFIIYCLSQFAGGVLAFCMFSSTYVLLIESTTPKYHTLFSNINIYFYVMGELFVLVAFFLTRNWQITSWFISLFSLVLVFLIVFFLPESPRWLYESGNYREAKLSLYKISKINKRKLRSSTSENYELTNEYTAFNRDLNVYFNSVNKNELKADEDGGADLIEEDKRPSIKWILKQMFLPLRNFLKLMALILVWNSVTLNYYGVTIGMTTVLQINPYVIYLLSAMFEVLGISLCHFNDIIGRKKALLIHLLLATLSSFLVSVLPDDQGEFEFTARFVLKAVLALLGRTMMSAAFNTVYTFTAELYETKIRSTVVLFLNCFGCIGTLLSPQINLLRQTVWRPLPYVVYSAFTFVGCIILCFLPETYHAEHGKKKPKRSST